MKELLVRLAIASVVVSAAAGVAAILAGDFDDFDVGAKVVVTSFCILGASIVTLPCAIALDGDRSRATAAVGTLASVVGFGLITLGVWTESESANYWQATATSMVVALGCAYGCLLELLRLETQLLWLRLAVSTCAGLLALGLVVLIWGEDLGFWDDGPSGSYWRLIGILSVLAAAGTIVVFIMSKVSNRGQPVNLELAAFCPRCGVNILSIEAESPCPNCSARFRVEYLT